MLATAANFETRPTARPTWQRRLDTFDAVAHLHIIDVSCPQQMLGVMKWVMEGNRGLVYIRVMRTPSAVLYGPDFEFRFGKGWFVHGDTAAEVVIVSSGRGVHEAIAAARLCESRNIRAAVVDMASIDATAYRSLHVESPHLPGRAEQRVYMQNLFKLPNGGHSNLAGALERVIALNTLDAEGRPRFIHSGTYEELIDAFGLTPAAIAGAIERALNK